MTRRVNRRKQARPQCLITDEDVVIYASLLENYRENCTVDLGNEISTQDDGQRGAQPRMDQPML